MPATLCAGDDMPLSFKAGYNRVPERSSDPKLYAKQVVQMVRDRANHSREDSEQYRRKVSKWYTPYRGSFGGAAPHPPPQRTPDPMDPTGTSFQVIETEVTDFNGPWWEPIDVLDWFPEPGKTDIRTMGWGIRRYWMDLDDIDELGARG